MTEIPLQGGNLSTVVRVGDTVRRPAGLWTPAVHALLHHLQAEGFTGAPRALGIDKQGREILTFFGGDVFQYPMPDYVWSEETLAAVATLMRRFHDVLAGFRPPDAATWRTQVGAPAGPIICHNDIAPYNTVFVAGKPAGLIDWDLAAPGTRLYDIAYAVWYYAPLYDDPAIPVDDQPKRLRLFCDAYGLTQEERRDLLPVVGLRQEVALRTIELWGREGTPGWAEMLRSGHAEGKRRDRVWLDRHWAELARSLA